jgi:hypothetical protein
MFSKRKILRLTLFLLLAGLLATGILAARQAYAEDLPVPPESELTKEELRRLAGLELKFSYYTSAQGQKQLKAFYRSELPKLGWKEANPLADVERLSGVKASSSLKEKMSVNLIFQKGDFLVVINFLPQGFSQDRRTRFTISEGKIDLNAISGLQKAATSGFPELLTQPQKDVAPVYPGAKLITLDEQPHTLKAVYFSKDQIEQVANFYKAEMAKYGWELSAEEPVHQANSEELGLKRPVDCPTCGKGGVATEKSVQMLYAQMEFANERQDSCKIALSYLLDFPRPEINWNFAGSEQAELKPERSLTQFTTIIVDYESKTK